MKVTATGIKIITNNLAGYKGGQLVPAKRVMVYDGIKMIDVKGILANNDLKTVWDTEEYLLEANDTFELESSGGNVESELNITSKCFKFDGSFDWVNVTINPSTIPPNTTNNEINHPIIITQEKSGLQVESICTQAADSYLNTVYSEPVVTHVEAEVADAWGSDVMLSVSYTQKVTHYYGSGNNIEETISGTINPTITSGSAKISNVTRNGKYIEVPSAGSTVYNSDRTVYTVTGYSFTVNGKTKNITGASINVKQEANIASYSSWRYYIYAAIAKKEYAAAPVSVRATVNSTRSRTCTYTSGYDPYGDNNEETQDYGWTASITSATGNSVTSSGSAGDTTAYIDLGPNTSTTSTKTTKVTFKSAGDSSKTSTITFTQSKDSIASSSVSVKAYNANAMQALASGGTVDINMTLKVDTTPVYSSGATGSTTTTYPSATVTSFVGSAQNSSGATKDSSGTKVNVKSAGTNIHNSAWTVYKITSVTGTYEGKSYTWSGTLNIQQEANTIKNQVYSNYYLDLTSNVSALHPSANPGVYINVECHRDKKDVYTSGDESSPVQENINANLSTSYGNLGSSVVLGGKSTTFIPNANNSDEERNVTINATCAVNGAIKDTLTLIQGAAEYSFNVESISSNNLSVPASGGTVEIVVSSTKNGVVTSKPTVTTGVTYASVQDSVFDDINGDRYVYTIKVNSHMNSSGRTFNVIFTQPGTGDTLSVPISQAKYQSSSGGGSSTGTAIISDAYFIDPEYSAIDTTVEFEGDSTISNVVIKIQSTNTTSGNVYGSYYVGNVTPPAIEQYTIENSEMSSNAYVVVYSGTKILASRKVEAI